jgi:hypothetical protein
MMLVSCVNAGEVVPPAIASLVQGGISMTKCQLYLVAALIAGALGVAGALGLGINAAAPAPTVGAERPTVAAYARAEDKPKDVLPQTKTETLEGRVFGPDGTPKDAARLLLIGNHEKPLGLGASGRDGRFSVTFPAARARTFPAYLVAQADDTGLDFIILEKWKSGEPVELHLVKDNVIRGRVVSTEGIPVPGVQVYPRKSASTSTTRWTPFWRPT